MEIATGSKTISQESKVLSKETHKELIGFDDCEPCFERTGEHVEATRNAGGIKMCAPCYAGKLPIKSDELAIPLKSTNEMAEFMSTLMHDVREGKVDPNKAHAICKVASTFLRVVEMQLKIKMRGDF
jgi:hypothetical protein